MTLYVGPVETHSPSDPKPPGITGNDWAHLVSTVSLIDLTAFITTNLITLATNIRTPLLGSNCTYVALDATQQAAAVAAGATQAPSDGKCRAQDFDANGATSWEP